MRDAIIFTALMDGGYTSGRIEGFASSIGKIPIIDRHADRNGNKEDMDPAGARRYKARTTVERTNSELKECFLPCKLYSRGKRAIFQIELSILMLDIKKIALHLRAEKEAKEKKRHNDNSRLPQLQFGAALSCLPIFIGSNSSAKTTSDAE